MDSIRNRRGTAQLFYKQHERLKSLNVGGGPSRNRTGVQGFAVLCVTTPPSGQGAGPLWRACPDRQVRSPDFGPRRGDLTFIRPGLQGPQLDSMGYRWQAT